MNTDTDRLIYLMKNTDIEVINLDWYDFCLSAAEENGRLEPNDTDYLEGFRRMIDHAMEEQSDE